MTESTMQPPSPVLTPREALDFLNRAGTVLAASLDYEQTLQDVAQLAVPDVADWCGMYLLEDDGTEREITSRHPDPEVEALILDLRRRRRETEGTSESLAVVRSGRSVLATDAQGDIPDELSAEQRTALGRLAARSYMIVPLLARDRVIGSLTLLSTRDGRHYTAEDLGYIEPLAVRCAMAIENARLYDTAARSLSLLDALFATVPVGLAFLDLDGRWGRVNEALAALDGVPVADHAGRTPADVLGATGAEIAALAEEVVRRGEPVVEHELDPLAKGPGGRRHWISSFTPVRGRDGQIVGVGVTVVDLTERRALLEAERDARLRADFLARAGVILDSSLDYEQTLANVAQIATPEIADWCAVNVLDESGALREVAAAHVDPERRALAREFSERYPPDPGAPTGAPAVARTGRTEFVREITEEMLENAVADPEQLELVRRLGLRSVVIAPLRARERTFGTLTLVNAESGRLFGDADVQLAEDLARRAGVAIENARLYTERTRIAHTLQAKLLPERLPEIPHAVVAARYRAAGELNEVGGDFYDVFPRSERDWSLVVGDVSGKGAEAAAVTALARYTLRAATLEEDRPSGALRTLNTAMLADRSSQFATVVLAYASARDDGGLDLCLALGGHPPPLILRASGAIDELAGFGSVLGVMPELRLVDTRVRLEPGDTMLLYTDGVTEAGPRGTPLGQAGLAALLRGLAGGHPQAIVDAVEQAVVAAQVGEPRDDIALLALGATPR